MPSSFAMSSNSKSSTASLAEPVRARSNLAPCFLKGTSVSNCHNLTLFSNCLKVTSGFDPS